MFPTALDRGGLTAEGKVRSERRFAFTIAAVFTAAGAAWILVTDVLLYGLFEEPEVIARLETAKGCVFIVLTALILYAVAQRCAARLTRAQDTISAIVDSIADGVLLLGRDRKIKHANPAAVRRLGYDRLAGMDASEFSRRFRLTYLDGSLVPPDEFISQRVFDETGPLHYKAVVHPQNGKEFVISATAAAVRSKAGVPAEVVVSVFHDITEADQLERLRDQFFAGAAHSLKTPVAIIKANVQILSRFDAPQHRRAIAPIERQCERIDRLVQNLLVLARLRSQTLKLHPCETELRPLVAEVALEMGRASRQHEVRTELVASPRAFVDEERFALALCNVIDDALRTSTPGSPVTVLLTQHSQEAVIGVRRQPLPPEERTLEAHGEYDDLGISRCVARTVISALGGALREDQESPESTTWIRLSVTEGSRGNS